MLYIYASRWILPHSRDLQASSAPRWRERPDPSESASPARAGLPGRSCSACWPVIRTRASRRPCRPSPDGPPRTLPALARIWDGVIEPFSAEKLAEGSDVVFLALPEEAAAIIAPALVDRGVRVIDLSGAFRLRDAASRREMVSGDEAGLAEAGLWPDRAQLRRDSGRAARDQPGMLPDGRAARARAARRRRGCWPARSSSMPSRASPARARSRASGRISPKTTAACPHTACSATGISPKSSRSLARRSRSCRTWCRSTAAFSRRFTPRSRQGRRRAEVADVMNGGV